MTKSHKKIPMNNENRQKTLAAFNDLWQGNLIRRTRSKCSRMTSSAYPEP